MYSLSRYATAVDINNAVENIPYTGGGTYTSSGLNVVRTQLMTSANGLRNLSSGVSRVLIVMTDGVSTGGYEPATEAALVRAESVNVFAMGVGQNLDIAQLESIASSPSNV